MVDMDLAMVLAVEDTGRVVEATADNQGMDPATVLDLVVLQVRISILTFCFSVFYCSLVI